MLFWVLVVIAWIVQLVFMWSRVMKIQYKPYLLSALLMLSVAGCADEMHRDIPRGPWKTESKRHSFFETLSVSGSHHDGKKLRTLVAQATYKTPIYARVMFNEPDTQAGSVHQRVQTLRAQLTKLGVAPHRIETQFLDPASAATQSAHQKHLLTVILDQYEVIPPTCPGWREYMDGFSPPEGEAQFGCISERNFAAMVAEPRDIFEAQQMDGPDGKRSANQIDAYRSGRQKTLKIESSKAGEQAIQAGSNSNAVSLGAN
jgi:pilus biogenesis lipoprotein CpaD